MEEALTIFGLIQYENHAFLICLEIYFELCLLNSFKVFQSLAQHGDNNNNKKEENGHR